MERTGLKLTDLSDKELVDLALQQNQAAFIVLYTRYNAGVKNHISKYIAQAEDKEDVALESFQKAFSQISSYNPEFKFSTWLYRIVARMNLIDHFGYKEIAEQLDLPINTVKTRIRRAKAQLLKMMEMSDELQ